MRSDLVFVAPITLCFLAMFLGVGGFILYAVLRTVRAGSATNQQQLLAEAKQWIAGEVPQLVPWTSNSINNISRTMSITWTKFDTLRIRGHVEAVDQNAPIMAFMVMRGLGFDWVVVATQRHNWYIRREHGGFGFWLNGEPWGRWQNNILYDAAGNEVGLAERPASWWLGRVPMAWDDTWYPVVLHGQSVGQIFVQHGIKTWGNDTKPPLIQTASTNQTAEQWLLALAAADIGFTSASYAHT